MTLANVVEIAILAAIAMMAIAERSVVKGPCLN